jgi:ABC-type phosphate transport system substrate-binding protein
MTSDKEWLELAAGYIQRRQYNRAREILEAMPNNPKAQEWLKRLNTVYNPPPQNLEEARADLAQARAELDSAQEDLSAAKRELKQKKSAAQRGLRISTAFLVFLGSLFGSLLGVAADFGEARNTVEELRRNFYPTLCVAGSDTILGLELGASTDWAQAFEENRELKVRIDAVGSVNGVRRAASGDCVHVLAMSDPIEEVNVDGTPALEKLAQNNVSLSCAAEVGYDIIVFITDINNPVSTLEYRLLRGMLSGNVTSWGEVASQFDYPVQVLARPGSGTTDLVLRRVVRYNSTRENPFPANTYQACPSNDDCLNQTLSRLGSLYWVSAAWMSTQPPNYLKVLSVVVDDDERSVNPLNEDVNLNTYPRALIRPLYMYVLDGPSISEQERQTAREFLEFVRSVEGQRILESHYFYTHFNQPRDFEISLPPNFDPPAAPNRQICRS